jgi:hypothetical protein
MEMPRHCLRGGELQLADVKARSRAMAGATLDFVEVTGVLDGFQAFL